MARVPNRIGQYTVVEKLPRGGQGTVYRCTQPPPLNRDVILKTTAVAGDRDRLARLRREAEALANCNHANVVTVFDYFKHRRDWFLVMEYVAGHDLADLVPLPAFTVDRALEVCLDAARGLAHAHGLGIIHRDFKPANVRVRADGTVKVIDFGLARSTAGSKSAHGKKPAVTGRRAIVGTTDYMSPEQTRGAPLGHRSDIWSFGVTLFECLARTAPFARNTEEDTFRAICEDEPRWNALPSTTPERVRELLRLCLRKDSDHRPPDMNDVVERLEIAIRGDSPSRSTTAGAHQHNLPRKLALFVGRGAELRRLAAIFKEAPFVTLTGAPGSGKSRLAVEFGWANLTDFPGGVWSIELAAITDPALVPIAAAAVLGKAAQAKCSPIEALAAHLRRARALLIFDNCEHLPDRCAALIDALIPAAAESGSRILATSQQEIGVHGERTFHVQTLALPPDDCSDQNPGELMKYSAVRLFVERARETGEFDLTAQNTGIVTRICRRLSGVPLALNLIAPLVASLSLHEIDDRLEDVLGTDTWGAGDERYRSVRASVECAYNRLTGPERTLLQRLSIFRGGMTLKAAETVCCDGSSGPPTTLQTTGTGDAAASPSVIGRQSIMSLMLALRMRSMIEYRPARSADADGRYDLLETIRIFAREKLEKECPEAAPELARRHLSYFQSLAEEAGPRLAEDAGPAWLDAIQADLDNIRLALETSERSDADAELGLRLIFGIHQFFLLRGYLTEGRNLLDRALKRSVDKPSDLRARALNARGGAFAWKQGDSAQAVDDCRNSLAMWRSLGRDRPAGMAQALNSLGTLLGDKWDANKHRACDGEGATNKDSLAALADESRACHKEAASIYEELGDSYGVAKVWLNWGVQEFKRGDITGARSLTERTLPVFQSRPDRRREAIARKNLGAFADFEGKSAEAVEHFHRGYLIERERDDRPAMSVTLAHIAVCAHRAGRDEEATGLLLLAWPDDPDGRGVLRRGVPDAAVLWDRLNDGLGPDAIQARSKVAKATGSPMDLLDALRRELRSTAAFDTVPIVLPAAPQALDCLPVPSKAQPSAKQ